MAEAPDIVLFDFKSSAEQFVTSVAKEQAQFEMFALLHAVEHIARVVVHRLVDQIHGFKAAELREAVAALLHFDTIMWFTVFLAKPGNHRFFFVPTFPEELPDADFAKGTAF